MQVETIHEDEHIVIRRQRLAPGEATPWHVDPCRRFTVVVNGTRLAIEYRDDGAVEEFDAPTGEADWEQPQARIHRAINRGDSPFEEVVTYYKPNPDDDPQPIQQETS